ncbi:MAG: hypothetical protein IJN15_02800 [Clostridia bacterium]|nr:hypothetical protein [Clostridia bacterium]
MKFSIGYQLPDELDSTAEIVNDYKEHIGSVYFSLPESASAREIIKGEYKDGMFEELKYIKEQGVSLTLLYNANCYGDNAVSSDFEKKIAESVKEAIEKVGITDITTTSPFVAKIVKKHFPEIKVFASVNMWIGTRQAMEYLGENFDGYYMQREYNRNFTKIKELSSWCRENGKQLKMLANSGCLYTCPFHTFHDNLVAHEKGTTATDNAMSRNPSPCWDMMYGLKDEKAAAVFLQESWVRPQDIYAYKPYFSEIKLATRMHSNPRRVIRAYIMGKFSGNMFDLTEPSFSKRFKNHILDATLFPDDWFKVTTSCKRNCNECGYCKRVAKKMLISKTDLEKLYMSK